VQIADLAVGDGDEADIVEAAPLVQGGEVFEIAVEPVDALGDDDVDLAGLDQGVQLDV
jgi:hypothetical protein